MNRILAVILIILIHYQAFAGIDAKNFGDITVDEVTSIYDADTFRANINARPDRRGTHVDTC